VLCVVVVVIVCKMYAEDLETGTKGGSGNVGVVNSLSSGVGSVGVGGVGGVGSVGGVGGVGGSDGKSHGSSSKVQYYRNGGRRTPLVLMCYVAYVLWALVDTLTSSPTRIKYLFMDPITKVWVQIGDPLALLLMPLEWLTPNMISYFHLFLGTISFFLIMSGNWNYRRLGVLIYAIRSILDSTDGALARARAAQESLTLVQDSVVDLDFVCDTASAILYGAAIVLFFLRNEDDIIATHHPDQAVRIFGSCLTGVFLKGFIMDMLMEWYEGANVEPSLLVAFLWKISSYDSWDNLKLFALLSITEYDFYTFSGYFSIPWVGIPTLLSLLEIYQLV